MTAARPRRRKPSATASSFRAALLLAVLPLLLAGAPAAAAPTAPTAVRVASPAVAGSASPGAWLRVLPAPARAVRATPLVTSTVATGYTPAQVRAHLGLTGTGAGQTIAIVTAYDAPNAASDLAVFNKTFGLPAPPSFRKVSQTGSTTKLPRVDARWALEAALDVQWAHAVAPAASILLVEATSSSMSNLLTAVSYAAKQPGVTVVSGSFGGPEFSLQKNEDARCRLTTGICVFASGDNGNPGTYPATNPFALAVGGTTLSLDSAGTLLSERAWSGSGGGVSAYSAKPAYQNEVTTAVRRTTPDVSYAADPATGFAVYSSTTYDNQSGWFQMGGTSAGAPQWAGILAAANQLRKAVGKGPLAAVNASGGTPLHTALYTSGALRDVTVGSNGICGALCTATTGYDAVTGLGSPAAGLDVVLRAAP